MHTPARTVPAPGHPASRAPRPRADEPRVHGALRTLVTPVGSRID